MTTSVYRIGLRTAKTLDDHAFGSALFSGRWHSLRAGPTPRRVVYAASSRALAQLEKRVHANGVTPASQALFVLTLPSSIAIDHATPPADWKSDIGITQRIGDRWLDAAQSPALWVPSYVEPSEMNILINPSHPLASRIAIVPERDPFIFDPRLV